MKNLSFFFAVILVAASSVFTSCSKSSSGSNDDSNNTTDTIFSNVANSDSATASISTYVNDASTNKCCFSAYGHQPYTISNAGGYYDMIDFIYLNDTIYAPSKFNAKSTSVAGWTSRNTTSFIDASTAITNIDKATLAQVRSYANNATLHTIPLTAGKIIVFKIASTNSQIPNSIGIFKVKSATSTATSITLRYKKAS